MVSAVLTGLESCACLACEIGIDDSHRAASVAAHKSANPVVTRYGACAVHIGEGNRRTVRDSTYYRTKEVDGTAEIRIHNAEVPDDGGTAYLTDKSDIPAAAAYI